MGGGEYSTEQVMLTLLDGGGAMHLNVLLDPETGTPVVGFTACRGLLSFSRDGNAAEQANDRLRGGKNNNGVGQTRSNAH